MGDTGPAGPAGVLDPESIIEHGVVRKKTLVQGVDYTIGLETATRFRCVIWTLNLQPDIDFESIGTFNCTIDHLEEHDLADWINFTIADMDYDSSGVSFDLIEQEIIPADNGFPPGFMAWYNVYYANGGTPVYAARIRMRFFPTYYPEYDGMEWHWVFDEEESKNIGYTLDVEEVVENFSDVVTLRVKFGWGMPEEENQTARLSIHFAHPLTELTRYKMSAPLPFAIDNAGVLEFFIGKDVTRGSVVVSPEILSDIEEVSQLWWSASNPTAVPAEWTDDHTLVIQVSVDLFDLDIENLHALYNYLLSLLLFSIDEMGNNYTVKKIGVF